MSSDVTDESISTKMCNSSKLQSQRMEHGGPLSSASVCRILTRVDHDRVGYLAQKRYSKRDDMDWFIQVTTDLYRYAVKGELIVSAAEKRKKGSAVSGAGAAVTQDDVQNGLNQVLTVRWRAQTAGDKKMLEFLSTLLHVKHDHAFPCPITVGAPVPGPLLLHKLPNYQPSNQHTLVGAVSTQATTTLATLVLSAEKAGKSCLVVLAGSWT